jgi:predicted Zn finger-like uncharacterized protein
MRLAQGIRTIGFRKWYERSLLIGHAHLAAVVMAVLGVMMALEAGTRYANASERIFDWLVALACAAAGLWALRRYLYLLTYAESVANQADCPQCRTYGRLELVQSDAQGNDVIVRCRHCQHLWRIEG